MLVITASSHVIAVAILYVMMDWREYSSWEENGLTMSILAELKRLK